MPGYEVFSNKHFFLLFIKINYIAELMAARKWNSPELAECALLFEKSGCDGITVCMSEKSTFIKKEDVLSIKDVIKGKLNLEIALSDKMIDTAQYIKPHKVIICPEQTEETINGYGSDLKTYMSEIQHVAQLLHDQDTLVSLLVEPDLEAVEHSKECGADFIEICTGKYCKAVSKTEIDRELDRIYSTANHAVKVGIKVSAGHGLTYKNIMPVLYTRALEEVNIGHSIISRSLSVGLPQAVEEMLDILD